MPPLNCGPLGCGIEISAVSKVAFPNNRNMHDSVAFMWTAYLDSIGERPERTSLTFRAWHFCDNEREADELATLVLCGRKRATAPCLWELGDDPLPSVNDLDIITYWSGVACCVIRTTVVEIRPFADVPREFAALEGEGDGSFEYWRRAHWAYYGRVLKPMGRAPSDEMPVVCQQFELVYPGVR